MSTPRPKRRPPFVTLPRHKRSHEVMLLKAQIRRQGADYGGRFISDVVLNEPGRPDLYNQWCDFCFPGTDRFTIWNAEFLSARRAFWDATNDMAHRCAAAMLNPEELRETTRLEFVPAKRSSTGKILSYKRAEREAMCFEQFGGRTFLEQWQKLDADIAREEPPTIHESFKLDRSYVYGIGLQVVLDVDVVNQASVENAIDRFFAIGERDWVSAEPVPRDRLPTVSEREAMANVKWASI